MYNLSILNKPYFLTQIIKGAFVHVGLLLVCE